VLPPQLLSHLSDLAVSCDQKSRERVEALHRQSADDEA